MEYGVSELIDLDRARILGDSLSDALRVSSALVELDGTVLIASRWQPICTDFHRANPRTRLRCLESDTLLANRRLGGQDHALYECGNGLINAAAPIVVDGEHVANFFMGQFLFEPPDPDRFRNMARQHGFDEALYLEALSEVPIIPKDRVRQILDLLSAFAGFLGELGLRQIRQREATETLDKARQRLGQIVQGLSVPSLAIDANHVVTHWNTACESLTGILARDVVGTRRQWVAFYASERPVMADLIVDGAPPEEIARHYAGKYQASALLEGAYEAEDFFPEIGNGGRWLHFTAAPLRNPQGTIVGAVETLQDITERKRAEERSEHLRGVIETIRDINQLIVVETGRDTLLRKTCDALVDARDYETAWIGLLRDEQDFATVVGAGSPGEAVSRFCDHVTGSHGPPCVRTALAREDGLVVVDRLPECADCHLECTRTGGAAAVMRIEHMDRLYGLLIVSLESDIASDQEEWDLLIEVASDLAFALHKMEMTEARRQAEETLQRREEQLRAVLDNATIHIWAFDGEWYPYLSREWYRYTGQDPALPRTFDRWIEVVHPDDMDETLKTWSRAWEAKDVFDAAFRLRGAEGEYRRFQSHAVPVYDENGELLRYQGYNIDITEQVRAEDALKKHMEHLEDIVRERTQELHQAQEVLIRKERLAVLGQLAGGVGHELRNPLAVISNAVYYLETALPDANETTREYLGIISSEVRSSNRIISDLLDFGRVRPAERSEAAVCDLVARVLERHPPPGNVDVVLDLPSDLPPLLVDPHQVDQVLTNLMTNACQAMPEGGWLTLTARALEERVSLTVSDTGCGMSAQQLETAFEPLFTTKARGIGLGLTLSRNLVEANGGHIDVKSEEGKGTAFTIVLPTLPQHQGG